MFFFVTQNGTLSFLEPIISNLIKSKIEYQLVITKNCINFAKKKELNFEIFNDISTLKRKIIKKNIKKIIISSSGNYIEYQLLKFCKLKFIKTIGIIDYFVNYKYRFTFKNKVFFPDKILTFNKITYREMINENIPKEKILICGHPGFEKILKQKLKKNIKYRFAIIIQPIKKNIKKEIRNLLFKFHEFINSIKKSKSINNYIILDHPDNFTKKKNNYHEESKIYIGVYSSLMFENYLKNRVILSFRDKKIINDPCPLTRWKLISSFNEIKYLNKKFIFRKNLNNIKKSIYGSKKRFFSIIKNIK